MRDPVSSNNTVRDPLSSNNTVRDPVSSCDSAGVGLCGARRERGSVMFLYPVGFVIVVLLGAIAVDLGNVWLQQRRLADAADSAANDAVTYGLDQGALRSDGHLALDDGRVAEVVAVSVAGQGLPPEAGVTAITVDVGPGGNPAVTVEIESSAELIFGRLVRSGGIAIRAEGTAELSDGGP